VTRVPIRGKAWLEERSGKRTVVKIYPHGDTARFKCWGSGVRNERIARLFLGEHVPMTFSVWTDHQADYAELEWLSGSPLRTDVATALDVLTAGEMLGRIHSHRSNWWGSLDGVYRFSDPRTALQSRFALAVTLLRDHDAWLAERVANWAVTLMNNVGLAGPPVLVHGDFGPSNLIRSGDGQSILDWEHARWGNAVEDWAKLRFAAKFPEPNGFGNGEGVLELLETGWTRVTGDPVPRNRSLESLLEVYFAISLGVFFGGDNPRMDWLRERFG
jgi:aminoglycoside phosphotransferase (APT) family kinase protein